MSNIKKIIKEEIEKIFNEMSFGAMKIKAIEKGIEEVEYYRQIGDIAHAGDWNTFIRKVENSKNEDDLFQAIEEQMPKLDTHEKIYNYLTD